MKIRFSAILEHFPFGLTIALPAIVETYHGSLWPYHYADGAVIRPMFEGLFLGVIVLLAFAIGVPLSLWDIRRGWKAHRKFAVVLGIAGVLLNLAPWPLGLALTDYFVAQRHLMLEQ